MNRKADYPESGFPPLEESFFSLNAALSLSEFGKAAATILKQACPYDAAALFLSGRSESIFYLPGSLPTSSTGKLHASLETWFSNGPLPGYLRANRRTRIAGDEDLPESTLTDSPESDLPPPFHTLSAAFWRGEQLDAVMVLVRLRSSKPFRRAEAAWLRRFHRHLSVTLKRISTVDQERHLLHLAGRRLARQARPVLLLDWNLQPRLVNRAALELCSIWQRGFPSADQILPERRPTLPPEILAAIRRCKARLMNGDGNIETHHRVSESVETVTHHDNSRLQARVGILAPAKGSSALPLVEIELVQTVAPVCANGIVCDLSPLTPREREVVALLREGLSNQEIADRLMKSVGTVKRQLHLIFRKLEVNSRSQLIAQLR